MRILLAEDEKNFALVLRNELEEAGYMVDIAGDGVEAVLKFLDGRHDFVLIDIKMPKLDGIGALRIIRKIDPGVPAVTFSGNAGTGEMAESVRVGAIRCFTKPFSVSQVKEELKKFAVRCRVVQ